MPGGPTKTSIVEENNISTSMLYNWIKKYGISDDMKKKKSPHNWSPEEKLNAIKSVENLKEPELGEYLRKNGLHSDHIEQWNQEILSALKSKFYPNKKDPKVLVLEKKNKKLQKSLDRKEKALAEAAAILILKKKADDYFSGEE